jgi:drug/metabolite transporter (DMT)-like permease
MPTIDFGLLIDDLFRPRTWVELSLLLTLLGMGWRLGSRTYWRVLAATVVGAYGVFWFLAADPGLPVGLWAGQAGLCVLVAGLLLDRARRLRRLERLTDASD